MCGIAGILNYTGQRFDIRESDLKRMGDSITHRGPDGNGIWKTPDGRVGFAHTRLSIIDLSPAGAQPMHSNCGRYHIVYNGEIYNHEEIRKELSDLGHRFVGRSDTETVLHSLMEWGLDSLDHFDGMFAFCFYDSEKNLAWLVRDRIGIKPLYYKFQNGMCFFGSEIKAMIAHPNVSPELNPLACYHFLTFLTTPAPMTMFKGIGKIPAGHLIEIEFKTDSKEHKISGRQWWDAIVPIPEDDRYSDETWVKSELRKILGSSIEKRMMSDVPFGVFLSGGVDSSTNVALMDAVMDRPVKTFTVGFKDHEEYNEFEHARKIRDLFKTEHHEILIDSDDMMAYLDQLVVSQDEPIADWVCVPLYFVSKLVRDSGTIVVQVGEGSDEQFIGYDHFMSLLGWHEKYWNPLRKLPKFMQAIAYGCTSFMRSIDDRWRGKKDIVYRAWKDRELFWGGGICYMEGFKNEIIKDRNHWEGRAFGENYIDDPVGWVPAKFKQLDSYGVVDEYLSKFDSRKPSADYIERMVYLEMKLRLVELLLMRVDKITMSTSVEARVPYLDHKMVEFSMNIPGTLKVKNNVPKYIMKEAVRGLIPDEIIDRKKMGFDAPVKSWLKGSLGDKAESIFRNTKLRGEGLVDFDKAIDILNDHRYKGRDHGYPVWSLLNLGLWYDSWIAGEDSG